MIVLAVDPGRAKCGVAVVDGDCMTLFHSIFPTEKTPESVKELCSQYDPDHVIIGCGTGCGDVCSKLISACDGIEPVLVEEKFSTLDARKLYYKENPPGWLLRLVPRGLLCPKSPIDDYAAVILARQFISELK